MTIERTKFLEDRYRECMKRQLHEHQALTAAQQPALSSFLVFLFGLLITLDLPIALPLLILALRLLDKPP